MSKPSTNVKLTRIDFDPFAGPELVRVVPATEPQLEIWAACQLGGDDACRAFNESISLRLSGLLDRTALGQAVRALVRRHDVLRSAFSADGRQLCVFRQLPVDLIDHNVSDQSEVEREAFIQAYLGQEALHLFDVVNGPLIKFSLLSLNSDAHVLILTAHRLISDGWSIGVMIQELSTLYSAYAQNSYPDLPEPVPFSRYAEAHHDFLKTGDYQRIEQFWINQFRDEVPVLTMPADFPRPERRTYESARQDFPVNKELVLSIKTLGTQTGSSLVTTLLAAFEVLIRRKTGQNDIIIGLPAAEQSVTGQYTLVGHCVNLLPLRSVAEPTDSFRTYLTKRKTHLLDAYEHQRLTFGSLLRKLSVARDSSRIPLVPVVFNVDMGLDDGVDFYGLQHKLSSNPRAYENFELSLNATGSEQSLQLEWSFNTQLFKPDTIAALHTEFEDLLRAVVDAPDKPVGELIADSRGAFRRTLNAWNATSATYPKEKPLHYFISEAARRFAQNNALKFGSQLLTYGELETRSNQMAALLLEAGVRPGDRVGIALDRSIELIVSLIAVLKTGAAYVPVDPLHPADRIAYMLTDAGCKLLLTAQAYQNRFALNRREFFVDTIWTRLADYPSEAPEVPVSGDDLVYILYTSGTTGQPKGAQIKHNSVVNVLLSVQKSQQIGPDDKTVTMATIAFDLATVEIYLPLICGAELVIVDSSISRNGQALTELLQTEAVRFVQATPATWRMLWESGWRGNDTLKIVSCAEALSNDLAGKLLRGCRSLWNLYGPTETTIYATGKLIQTADELITIGKPIANTQVFILDEQQQLLSTGQPGEICIAGDGLANGYLNQPELTASKFINHPFSDKPGLKLYRTGDLGQFLPNGEIQYLGRLDQQVKIRGRRIELGEIEHHLLRQPGISNAVVIAREDTPGDQRLTAYVVADSPVADEAGSIQCWKDGLRQVLPDYMLPRHYLVLAELPVNANGKIDRKALPEPTQPPVSNSATEVSMTATQRTLAAVWRELLRIDHVGPQDNFFELGGHSLLAVQVMARIEQVTGRKLPLSVLFEAGTIEKLAQAIERADELPGLWNSLVPIKPGGSKMPVYFIHGSGLNVLNFHPVAFSLDADQPVYGLQAQGLNGVDLPERNMQAIATHYIAQIRLQNPDGPYALAGYSFGGIVAYEMAKQLKAMGKEVKFLAMLDTYAYSSTNTAPLSARFIKRLRLQLPKARFIMSSLRTNPDATLKYQWQVTKRKISALSGAFGLPTEYPEEEAHGYSREINQRLDEAYYTYQLTPYDGMIYLFRAQERVYFVDDLIYLGWNTYATQGVKVLDVPGDHKTMLLPPNEKAFARILQDALDNC